MEDFKNMSNTALFNLLAKKTVMYTQMLAGNIKTDEFYNCKQFIEELTVEIESRIGNSNTPPNSIKKPAISLRNK